MGRWSGGAERGAEVIGVRGGDGKGKGDSAEEVCSVVIVVGGVRV